MSAGDRVACFWCEPVVEGENLYRRTDTGETFLLGQAPPGAMYYADWLKDVGGYHGEEHVLIVITPFGPWNVTAGFQIPAPGKWTVTGSPPRITARPSIGQGQRPDGTWTYHAWLNDGVLEEI